MHHHPLLPNAKEKSEQKWQTQSKTSIYHSHEYHLRKIIPSLDQTPSNVRVTLSTFFVFPMSPFCYKKTEVRTRYYRPADLTGAKNSLAHHPPITWWRDKKKCNARQRRQSKPILYNMPAVIPYCTAASFRDTRTEIFKNNETVKHSSHHHRCQHNSI